MIFALLCLLKWETILSYDYDIYIVTYSKNVNKVMSYDNIQ